MWRGIRTLMWWGVLLMGYCCSNLPQRVYTMREYDVQSQLVAPSMVYNISPRRRMGHLHGYVSAIGLPCQVSVCSTFGLNWKDPIKAVQVFPVISSMLRPSFSSITPQQPTNELASLSKTCSSGNWRREKYYIFVVLLLHQIRIS